MTPDTVAKPKKEDHNVRVSSFYAAKARSLAAKQDKAFAEILGDAVEIGIATLVDQDNKMNIWERTSLKAELISLLDGIPQEKLGEAIAVLRELK